MITFEENFNNEKMSSASKILNRKRLQEENDGNINKSNKSSKKILLSDDDFNNFDVDAAISIAKSKSSSSPYSSSFSSSNSNNKSNNDYGNGKSHLPMNVPSSSLSDDEFSIFDLDAAISKAKSPIRSNNQTLSDDEFNSFDFDAAISKAKAKSSPSPYSSSNSNIELNNVNNGNCKSHVPSSSLSDDEFSSFDLDAVISKAKSPVNKLLVSSPSSSSSPGLLKSNLNEECNNIDLSLELEKYFGFNSFRGDQKKVITELINNRDCGVFWSTGMLILFYFYNLIKSYFLMY
jgi:hypothetical protein